MEKKFKILGWVAFVAIFLIFIGYGLFLVHLDNQERVKKIVHQGLTESPASDVNEKLMGDLAHTKYLLMQLEDQKRDGKLYSVSEEKELRQFIADLQATLEKKQLK